ncbi:gamma-aminobutyraldehyde dehydrogenase [Nocardiopsis salina]|uniref:gamma-aminobutyraldehyde dehydrogenase n=1 Tax=Nocardiopsis salina TaxID=245836 RepID=UPI0003469399|nr:gamma-aminobutyraldehyde dehydrogenase [Nocardiopsis salina]
MTDVPQLYNFVGGTQRPAANGRTYDLVDPVTEEVFARAPLSGPEDVDAAMRTATETFESWRDTTPAQRQIALFRIAEDIERRADEIVRTESRNTGKPIGLTTEEEIPMILDAVRFFAGAARCLEGRSAGEYMAGLTSWVRREPLGVCAQITPWNYPMLMAVWKWAPAIAAGNTVVLKPSDTTPMTTLLSAEIMAEHLPPGVFNVVCGDRDTGRHLVAHPVPELVSITGSVRAGREVAQAAGGDLKRVHLELGGKAPVVVFDDADPASAAAGIAEAGYFNAGQDCTAATRVLAGPGVHDAFLEELTGQAQQLSTGPPSEDGVAYGPLNNAGQFDRIAGFVDRLPSHAEVLAGGRRARDPGFFYEPTVVGGLRQDDEIVQNEVFGPVITVQRFDDEDQAVAWANGVEYGLASSLWTRDHGRALRVSRRLDFGCVWINCHIPLVAEMPHGGFKNSGHGKDLSMYGFEDYTRVKHVMSSLDG